MVDLSDRILSLCLNLRQVYALLLIGDVGMNGYFLLLSVQGFKYNYYSIFQSGSVKCKGYIYGAIGGFWCKCGFSSYFPAAN